MSGFSSNILSKISFLTTLLLFVPQSFAAVSVTVSNEQGLSFRWNRETALGKAGSRQDIQVQSTVLPADDSSAMPAKVICFWSPSKEVKLNRAELVLGSMVSQHSEGPTGAAHAPPELVQPVMVRGRWLGKVIFPEQVYQNGAWHNVSGIDVDLSFGALDPRTEASSHGRLDQALERLAVNSAEAASWQGRLSKPADAAIYNPFSQSTNWLRIAITESGIYKITRTDLTNAGFTPANIDPRTIRLFHASGKPLPVSNFVPRDSLAEMAIRVVGEEDGAFGNDDFVMFYANGGDFTVVQPKPDFVRHPYSDRNVYYLTYGGNFANQPKRMAIVDGVVPASDTLQQFTDFLQFEEDVVLSSFSGDVYDYYNWYWGLAGDIDLTINLPQPVALSVNRFRLRTTSSFFNLSVNNVQVPLDSSVTGQNYYFTTDRLSVGQNTIHIDYVLNNGYTDNLFVELERGLTLPESGELMFYTRPDGARHAYRVEGQINNPTLLNVSDIYNQQLYQVALGSSSSSFSHQSVAGLWDKFVLASQAAIKTPFSIVATQIDDIRAIANQADYIIITHDNFYTAAVEYSSYRRQHDDMRVRVVRISDIYAQFSGGRLDPIAVRDFLRHAYYNWSGAKPSCCLLAGDGVFDFRNRLGTGAVNYIPPYVVPGDETVSDENFAYVDSLYDLDADNSYPGDRGVDIVIARWPVKSTAEFQVVFDKTKSYEAGEDAGSWRNTITLIADDENHPNSGPELFHTTDTEELAATVIPSSFDLDKIYGISYPFGAASEKPAMREDIIRAINDGRLIVNYTGHGNPNLWADERVFRRTQDIPRLNNSKRLPLIFNASCSIGFFDDPRSEGMAEDFLRYPSGGAVGTISATRLVFARPNFEFNKAGMQQLLGHPEYTIAEAMFVAKLLRQGSFGVGDNDRKYIYIGDPVTRLAIAPDQISFTKFEPDSLVALAVTELAGQVEDRQGTKQVDFNGTATVNVFDDSRQRIVTIASATVSYTEYGPQIFRGEVAVTNGDFNIKFVVPKDITYGGNEARISTYAASANSGAAGVIFPIAIGSINKDVSDSTGPEIVARLSGGSVFTDGMTVNAGDELTIELSDSLGINLSGEIGHGIEVIIDDDREFSYELTDSFTYFANSYQQGSAKMKLPSLPEGEHTIRIKAWDSANNSSQKVLGFNVSSMAELEIRDFLCYPNPVSSDCEFSYTLSDEASEVSLKLFTLSGLEIWSVDGLPGTRGTHQGIRWNGFDADGDRPANGVYLMQLSAHPATGNGTNVDNNKATATGKLVMLK